MIFTVSILCMTLSNSYANVHLRHFVFKEFVHALGEPEDPAENEEEEEDDATDQSIELSSRAVVNVPRATATYT